MSVVRQINSRVVILILALFAGLFIVFQLGIKYGTESTNSYSIFKKVQLKQEEEHENLITQLKNINVTSAKPLNDDEHMLIIQNPIITKKMYPKRINMGPCPKLYGKLIVFVAVVESSYKT